MGPAFIDVETRTCEMSSRRCPPPRRCRNLARADVLLAAAAAALLLGGLHWSEWLSLAATIARVGSKILLLPMPAFLPDPGDENEELVLARIRYPDREAALVCGRNRRDLRPAWRLPPGDPGGSARPLLAMGMTSVRRRGASYVEDTLALLFNRTTAEQQARMAVVVAVVDPDRRVADGRARDLCARFRVRADSGHLQVIRPPANIYPRPVADSLEDSPPPETAGTGRPGMRTAAASAAGGGGDPLDRDRPLTYDISRGVLAWRSKLVLDYSYLFAYSADLADYFVNLEDDVLPAMDYFAKTADFVKAERNRVWVSLKLSKYMSIGRLYKNGILRNLVSFLLSSYTQQPVDVLMESFDPIFLANLHRCPSHKPPLFTHRGLHSSKFTQQQREDLEHSRAHEASKAANPPGARLYTNIKEMGSYGVNRSTSAATSTRH